MIQNDVIQFLIRAKKATYAGKGGETQSSRPESHDLVYREGDYMYYDTYFGGDKFIGEEALWIKGKPFWSMNYVGRVVGENFSGDFLKAALLEVPEDMPYRGPLSFEQDGYQYKCTVSGDFEWFQGYESIAYEGKHIYECFYHGGIIE